MNKNPVTESFIDSTALNSPNPKVACADSRGAPYSYPDATGTNGQKLCQQFPQRPSRRVQFPDGRRFGHVPHRSIDMVAYQARSTIAGEDVIDE